MGLRIAVTGASGFIGQHVMDRLALEQVEIVAVGRRAAANSRDGIFATKLMDLAHPGTDVYAAIGRPNVLVHLAWQGLPNYQSLHHIESEFRVQYDFLRSLVVAGLPHLVVSGTCFEYGLQEGCLSEAQPTRPVTPYGLAKTCLQQALAFLCASHATQLTWARLFYLWGEGQAAGSLYASLAAAAQRGDATFNMSAGEQLRDYLNVREVADTLVRLAIRADGAGVVNVCSGVPVSVGRMVERWVAENGWTMALNKGYYPYPAHEPMAFWGDRSKLDGLLATLR